MKKNLYRIGHICILVCLCAFFFLSLQGNKDSSASFKSVYKSTIKSVELTDMVEQDNLDVKRFLQLDPSQYKKIVYYKNSDGMKASEYVLVEFANHAQQDDFEKKINARVETQIKVFGTYAPKETAYLKKAVIDIRANYALYAVGEDAEKMDEQFLAAL